VPIFTDKKENAAYPYDKINKDSTIDKQFKHNKYIREYFRINKSMTLDNATKCWKSTKNLPGHNRYEDSDLAVLGLIINLDKIHTTKLGLERIKRNLCLEVEDVVNWCKQKVHDANSSIIRKGKNWYVTAADCKITINTHSFTIITAHKTNNK
jgi:hypothetical protein